MSIKSWSTSASSNNAKPPYGAPEGWFSGQVNDWARQSMADIRDTWENAPWFDWGDVPSYVSATQFTIASDITGRQVVSNLKRVRADLGGTFIYGTITNASYSSSTGLTTVTVSWSNSGALTSNLSAVAFGLDDGNLDLLTQTVAAATYAYNGQFGNNVDTTQTASFTLTTADSGKTFDTSNFTAAGTITLPATATEGNYFGIMPNATYQITILPNGANFQFADGSTSTVNYNMTTVGGSTAWFFWNGSYWEVIDFGKFVVPDAINNNEAVALGQFSSSATQNGYQKFPSGLIIQWGHFTFSPVSNYYATFSFPIAFPNACLSIAGNGTTTYDGATLTTGGAIDILDFSSLSTSGALLRVDSNGGAALSGTHGIYYIAIGY